MAGSQISGVLVGACTAGALLIYAGLRDVSPVVAFKDVLSGKPPGIKNAVAPASLVVSGSKTIPLAPGVTITTDAQRAIENRVAASGVGGLTVTSSTGGSHVAGSDHYKGTALDISGSADAMEALAKSIYGNPGGVDQLIHWGASGKKYGLDHGKVVPDLFFAAFWAEHRNHVHISWGA